MMAIFNHRKKLFAISFIVLMITAGVSAVQHPVPQARNLKVLPKDISDQKLDSIMHSYNKALGVKCEFCHVKSVIYPGTEMDYASDKEPMKENARAMITMMIDINKRYFYFDTLKQPAYLNTVACITCHRGQELPPDNNK